MKQGLSKDMDPTLKLSLALHANPGVYAVLLGSGVSRSAGIPTGWEVTLDLIRKLAAASGVSLAVPPEEWYRQEYSEEPEYSRLLEKITSSAAERASLLRSYFEASREDRAAKLKVPTPAHHAVAQLVQRGTVRVIVTTNFDRLVEQALENIGWFRRS